MLHSIVKRGTEVCDDNPDGNTCNLSFDQGSVRRAIWRLCERITRPLWSDLLPKDALAKSLQCAEVGPPDVKMAYAVVDMCGHCLLLILN